VHEHTLSRPRRLSVGTGTAVLSLGLCLCAGQLISTPAASAAAPVAAKTAVTAQAVSKVRPTIRNSTSNRNLTYGSKVRVTAKLINPKNGKVVTSGTVRLQAYRNGKWRTWSSKRLGNSGTVNLYAEPHISGYLRTQYTGSSAYLWQTSGKIRVNVKASGSARVLAEARSHTGALYKFAAEGPKRFDCSGFTKYVYKKAAGKNLPHKANLQQRYGKGVSKGSKRVGDLIVFRSGSYGSHVGIYAGNGYMYDSPHTGARVGKHKIYGSNYVVRRLVA
jgi:cell wall-associated NlpC family hydrolase